MLATLLALGLLDPLPGTATGPLIAPDDSIVTVPRIPALTAIGAGIPFGAPTWQRPFDPADRSPYAFDFTGRLTPNEFTGTAKIASIERTRMSAIGAAAGVQVDADPDRPPIITDDGYHVQLWFRVDPIDEMLPAFADGGLKVPVSVLVHTDETPYRSYEATGVLIVRQQ